MSLIYTDPEEMQRANARRKVSQSANAGSSPRRCFSQADLEWAFATEDEQRMLASLEAKAAETRSQQLEEQQRKAAARDLSDLTAQILKDWDEEEKRARHEKAHAEARRRLGLDG